VTVSSLCIRLAAQFWSEFALCAGTGAEITPKAAACRQLTDLKIEVLILTGSTLNNSLVGLREFSALHTLELNDTGVDNEALKHFAKLPLTRLVLSAGKIDDNGIKYLATTQMANTLQELNIEKTQVTGSALPVMGKFEKLTELNISGTNISAREIVKSAKYLSRITKLSA
jgi:hypothetical protein